jgi:hypothetical protein
MAPTKRSFLRGDPFNPAASQPKGPPPDEPADEPDSTSNETPPSSPFAAKPMLPPDAEIIRDAEAQARQPVPDEQYVNQPDKQPVDKEDTASIEPLPEVELPPTPRLPTDMDSAQAYQTELQRKMTALAEDFSLGKINRRQFEAVYAHYREQRQIIDALINSMNADAWRHALSDGATNRLLERNAARILCYALYDHATGQALATSGQFKIDPHLIAPMIAAHRSAADFSARPSSREIERGYWLSFVPGHYTTLVALFSLEPAGAQLQLLQDLHHDFELANAKRLSEGRGREPAQRFMNLWALEHML